jgi:hypothetical protein
VRTTHESECPDIGPICDVRDEPPQIHDQSFTVGELVAENSHGYRAGHRFALGVSGEVKLVGSLRASAGADVANEQPERWGGIVQQDGNLGRTDVLVGGGLYWGTRAVQLGLTLRIPVYTHVIGHHGQLEYPGLLKLNVGTVFGQ